MPLQILKEFPRASHSPRLFGDFSDFIWSFKRIFGKCDMFSNPFKYKWRKVKNISLLTSRSRLEDV